ncbi:MAG: hypothetical protein ACRYGP_01985 [Janthinobacterium lividum]
MAALAGRPWRDVGPQLPKDLIARAVREPLLRSEALQPWRMSGSCAHQAEIGRCILRDRFGVDATIVVGDLMTPIGGDRHHTYTRDDGRIRVEAGAYHAWLILTDGSYADFAAWELPARMERQGLAWTGSRPDYLWDTPAQLRALGYFDTIDRAASIEVTSDLAKGKDEEFLALYLRDALAVLDRYSA